MAVPYKATIMQNYSAGFNSGSLDIFSLLIADDQFSAYTSIFALFSMRKVTIRVIPTVTHITVGTEAALYGFAFKEGPTGSGGAMSSTAIVDFPGAKIVNNATPLTMVHKVNNLSYFPSNMTDTTTSMVPKITFYYTEIIAASTGIAGTSLLITIDVLAKSRFF